MVQAYFKGYKPVSDRLIIFTRYPEPGKTKTRLISALGPNGAANLQRQMTEHTLTQVHAFWDQVLSDAEMALDPEALDIEIRFDGGSEALMQSWLGDYAYQPQGKGDLGARLIKAFQAAFDLGKNRVVIIGIDCPELGATQLSQAFDALKTNDLVLGPALDGGYYLIGLTRPVPALFQDVPWGSENVLKQTLKTAQEQETTLAVAQLDPLTDVDRPEDLEVWVRTKRERQQNLSLSIIIPTLNEEGVISKTLTALQGSGAEIIVVDGWSLDKTAEIAETFGALVVNAPPGRAYQMNEGTSYATGEILMFLHADTQLPLDFATHVRATLSKPGVVAGAFRLGIEGKGWQFRCIEWGTNLRSKLFQLPYGDQTLFLKRSLFYTMGRFPDLPIMEDLEMIRRLQKRGFIALAPAAVHTSNRRWKRLGVCQTLLINQLMLFGYFMGIPPKRLANWYRYSPY